MELLLKCEKITLNSFKISENYHVVVTILSFCVVYVCTLCILRPEISIKYLSQLFFTFFLMYMSVVSACMSVCLVPMGVRRGH